MDGSKTPEKIPDQLAYRHFLVGVAEHAASRPVETDRQKVRLAPIGFSEGDTDALRSLLGRLRAHLDAIQAARSNAETLSLGARMSIYADLKLQEDALITGAIGSLQTTLSADGVARLDQYVKQHVKRKIVVYGSAVVQP